MKLGRADEDGVAVVGVDGSAVKMKMVSWRSAWTAAAKMKSPRAGMMLRRTAWTTRSAAAKMKMMLQRSAWTAAVKMKSPRARMTLRRTAWMT